MKLLFSIFTFAIFEFVYSEELPSGFKRCSSKDTACLKEAIDSALPLLKSGISALGVPSLDPLKVAKLTVGGGKIVQLVQNYEKIEVIGLSQSKLNYLSFDLDKGKIFIGFDCPRVDFKGSYDVKGKILILDVYGKGTCDIRLDKMKLKIDMDVQKYQKNGDTYLKVTKFVMNCDPELVVFDFVNLFNGNKQLGDNVNRVLNDNWKEIYDELEREYMGTVSTALLKLSNKLFEKIPIKYIFSD